MCAQETTSYLERLRKSNFLVLVFVGKFRRTTEAPNNFCGVKEVVCLIWEVVIWPTSNQNCAFSTTWRFQTLKKTSFSCSTRKTGSRKLDRSKFWYLIAESAQLENGCNVYEPISYDIARLSANRTFKAVLTYAKELGVQTFTLDPRVKWIKKCVTERLAESIGTSMTIPNQPSLRKWFFEIPNL